MDIDSKKRKLIEFLAEKNILASPDFLDELNSTNNPKQISELINRISNPEAKTEQKKENGGNARVIFSHASKPKNITAQDFINHFNSRYNQMKKTLQQRIQLENVISINRLRGKEKETASVIAMVSSAEETKNGVMLGIEDQTGSIKAFISNKKTDLFLKAKDIVADEMLGITGSLGKGIIFVNDLIFPDIPMTSELKKSPDEEYAVFISDLHIGSNKFLEDMFLRFISWIRGELGDEKQRETASKVKYLFVVGDAIDGISIYPAQKEELSIMTFRQQYEKLAEYLKMIPQNIKIIICPGQHDIVHIAEPQPPLPKEYCQELYDMQNVILVSNPAVVNIASKEGFPGFDVLLYHGASYSYYADDIESIRIQKPNISERAELVMKLLLQKRHLAPAYDESPHMPTEKDRMFIENIPDIFASGDVHRSAIFSHRRSVIGIIGSCFQSKTSYQEKAGHVPDPGKVPILNLKTREAKMLNFMGAE